jgi:LPS export ABC transporter protein LptC
VNRNRITALTIVAALAGIGCEKQSPEVVASAAAQSMRADQVMFGVQQFITQDGIRRGVLNADTAYVFEDSGKVDVRKVRLNMFNETGKSAANLTSKAGTLDTRTQGMIARGNVVLITADGQKINTEELHYDPNAHRVWSDVTTTMVQNGGPLTGDGFTADDQMRNIKITRPRGQVSGGIKF